MGRNKVSGDMGAMTKTPRFRKIKWRLGLGSKDIVCDL
jgi:hypothetical protein